MNIPVNLPVIPLSRIIGGENGECGTCRFWIGQMCRRYGPIVAEDGVSPSWPMTSFDHWCGDYERKA